jgi:glucose/arabinose dehydrogenase
LDSKLLAVPAGGANHGLAPRRSHLVAVVVAFAAALFLVLLPQSALADMAHGKPATASSQEGTSLGPANAVDGDPGTRWSSQFNDGEWWQVDLGSNQQVNEVVINWETAYASQYKIQTSTDGTNFTTATTVNITSSGPADTTFSTVTARYVRILGVVRATGWGISFWEVNVYGPNDPNPGGGGSTGPLPNGFRDVPVFTGLNNPTAVRFAPFPDSRIFVAQKGGIINEYDSLGDTTPTQVADLRTEVHNFWDRGLLGLAVDPQWPARPYIYVSYAYDAAIGQTAPKWGTPNTDSDGCPSPPGATTDGCVISGRLSKLTINTATNQMTNEQVLINDWCQQFPSHSVGDLHFGPDGALYMSGGEGASFNYADYGQSGNPVNPCNDPPGGSGGSMTLPTAEGGSLRSQSMRRPAGQPISLDGSIIRVNPDTGAGLPDNPFASNSNANAQRVIAEGFRNPFRWTFRPGTNELWVGDVGDSTWEEIDRDTTPTTFKNYGWPCYEGAGTHAGFGTANICTGLAADTVNGPQNPYYAYNHSSKLSTNDTCPTPNGSSITGISFYTGGNYPSSYNNALFFADHSRNCLWVANAGTNGLPDMSTVHMFDSNPSFPVDLQQGPNGDLFYASLDGGTINEIQYTAAPSNTPPTAKVNADKTTGSTPLTVNFDATGSSDPDTGDTLTYSWDLNGDGTFGDSTAAKPSFTYTTAGTYTVKVKVTDSHGASDTASITITAGNTPPTPVIDTPASTLTYSVGDLINFTGHATDAEDGTEPAARLTWSLIIHHCPTDINSCHTHHVQDFAGVSSGSFNAPDHEYPSYLELDLTATDAGGLSNTTSVRLDPKTTVLNFASVPSGLTLGFNTTTGVTPFSKTVIIGSANSISATSPQTLSGNVFNFSSWSDSGLATHNITAPSAGATYTATYAQDTSNVNLALNKTATSSSNESSSYPPKNGNDGSTSTRWSSSFKNNQWWQVDLGSVQQVAKVTVNWEAAYASQYQIQTSTDGTTFTTQATVNATSQATRTTTFPAVGARYVRILGVTRATQWGFSFWEAQVFGPGGTAPPPTQVELAKGKPATASSVEGSSLGAAKANDGSTSTRWSSQYNDGEWWQVDLGSAQQVNQVTVNWETAYASQYQIQTSTDGTSFTTQATVNITAPGTQTTSFSAVSARYVRIVGVKRATGWGISIWEAQVFGPSS